LDKVAAELKAAQDRAASLFNDVVKAGLITPGKLESELTQDIYEMARDRYEVKRHWHKRVVRAGTNTLLTYHDQTEDRAIAADDTVYLDFGPVFEEWEADFGRTYVVGADPDKHRLVADLGTAFEQGKALYERSPELTGGELYDFMAGQAAPLGWAFGAPSAGHLVGHFPHETAPGQPTKFSIRHGNTTRIRERDANGAVRHWILEVHFVDPARGFGGFYEQLLTV
jgi:Xaa-Pro aminopeptidase